MVAASYFSAYSGEKVVTIVGRSASSPDDRDLEERPDVGDRVHAVEDVHGLRAMLVVALRRAEETAEELGDGLVAFHAPLRLDDQEIRRSGLGLDPHRGERAVHLAAQLAAGKGAGQGDPSEGVDVGSRSAMARSG